MLVATTSMNGIANLKAHIAMEFEAKYLGVINQILGMITFKDRYDRKV